METLTVGLVGKRAGAFIAGLQSLPQTRIVAVCEPDPEQRARLAERAGELPERAQFANYDDLLDQAKPDVVVLGTPMPLHVPQAVQALGRGTHVLSEVTAAVDLEQCAQLVEAVRHAQRASGAQYMMGENYCYRKDVVLVRAMARAGLFGTCYFAEGEYLHDVKSLHHFPDGSPTWRATWQVGKRGCTYGTHSLGPALEFFGPQARVVTVSCVGSGIHTDPEHPHDDTVLMLCQVSTQGPAGSDDRPANTAGVAPPDGLIKVRLDMMSNRPHAMAYYSLQGTRGCYEGARGSPSGEWAGGDQPKVWLDEEQRNPSAPFAGSREWRTLWDYEPLLPEMWRHPTEAALRAGHGGGDYFIVRDFIGAIQEGKAPPVDVYRALDYTVPGLLSEQSIAQGGVPLPVPDFRR